MMVLACDWSNTVLVIALAVCATAIFLAILFAAVWVREDDR